jgi:uracil-DNA glycosylase family 4
VALKQLSGNDTLEALNARVIACERCPRLRAYCREVAEKKRRAYMDWEYWGKPVPAFGDAKARVLILGLAPGAHGSNRTGRPFTGDGSGDFLYPVLYEAGYASQPLATSRDDGMKLRDAFITSVGRCAPPDNKPLPEELVNCSSFLDEEIALLARMRVVVCLGEIAFDGFVAHLIRTRQSLVDGELSSIAAEHEYGEADEGDVSGYFSTRSRSCRWEVIAGRNAARVASETGEKMQPLVAI